MTWRGAASHVACIVGGSARNDNNGTSAWLVVALSMVRRGCDGVGRVDVCARAVVTPSSVRLIVTLMRYCQVCACCVHACVCCAHRVVEVVRAVDCAHWYRARS